MREHWREADFWRWWWHNRVPFEVKAFLSLVLLALMLGGGWVAADRLSSASASVSPTSGYTFETTIQKVVTVREHGRIVRKLVPVVKRVFLRPQTAFLTLTDVRTQTITTPGGVRVVQKKIVQLVPVVKRKVVTVNGKTSTLVTTQLMPTTNFETTTLTQTQVQTETQTRTQTQTQTQTNVVTQPVTNTVTNTDTVVQTATVTVPTTITETTTTTDTQTETDTVTVTETVTTGP